MMNWERNWRGSGVVAVLLAGVATVLYGYRNAPKVGASGADVVSFFGDNRTPILIATVLFSLGFLSLLWFGVALATDLRDAGEGGWATAVTAASAVLGAMLFARMTVRGGLAFSIADSGGQGVASAFNDLGWALSVMISFSAAMFVMAGTFGLRQAGMISNRAFGLGVAAVVVVLLGGTMWATSGFWAPYGAIGSIPESVLLAWVFVTSVFLYRRSPITVATRTRPAVNAA